MAPGDRVYYLYPAKDGTIIKFAAVVLGLEADGILIRVGRFDVHKQELSTFESTVSGQSLEPRQVPCSFEDELTAADPG
jgi:hypothetical protein